MQITHTRDKLVSLSKCQLSEEKITSLLHRIKTKDSPNQKLFNGIKKMLLWDDEDLLEIKEYCFELDFDNVKSNGRGSDRGRRQPPGSVKAAKERRQNEWDEEWNRQTRLGCGSWVTPPNH